MGKPNEPTGFFEYEPKSPGYRWIGSPPKVNIAALVIEARRRVGLLCNGCYQQNTDRCPLNKPLTENDVAWLKVFDDKSCNAYKRKHIR